MNAIPMIAACMQRQTGEAGYWQPTRVEPVASNPEYVAETDRGLDGVNPASRAGIDDALLHQPDVEL
jgi:hypothetical protein